MKRVLWDLNPSIKWDQLIQKLVKIHNIQSGETATIRVYSIGHFSNSGKITKKGSNFYKSSSEQLSYLNNPIGVFEFEVNESRNYQLKVWKWQ